MCPPCIIMLGGGPRAGGGPYGRGGIGIPGKPTPLPGPASPAGAAPNGVTYMALPIGLARPGPVPLTPSPTRLAGYAGGASALIVTILSPRSSTNPSALFYSRSFSVGRFGLILRNSSVSASTKFICLSKAMNVPTSMRESWIVTRMR